MKKLALWVVLIAIVVAIVTVLCLFLELPEVGDGNLDPPSAETEPRSLDELRTLFPEYFGLDTSEGLVIYAAKDASGALGCGIMEGMNKKYASTDFFALRRVSVEEMKSILSTYDISDSQIAVAVSEKVIHFWLSDVTADQLREHFDAEFADYEHNGSLGIYDRAFFDIDFDGVAEECVLSVSARSRHSYILTVIEQKSDEAKSYMIGCEGFCYPYFSVNSDGEMCVVERSDSSVSYLTALKTGTGDNGKYFTFSKTETADIVRTNPEIYASRYEITLCGREEKIYIRDTETVQWISLLAGSHIWGTPKGYSNDGMEYLCRIEAFGESGEALNVYTVWDENTVSASDFEGFANSDCTGFILSYFDYLLTE